MNNMKQRICILVILSILLLFAFAGTGQAQDVSPTATPNGAAVQEYFPARLTAVAYFPSDHTYLPLVVNDR
jgi:hypothetical protein